MSIEKSDNFDLTGGVHGLFGSLQRRFPHLSEEQTEQITDIILDEIRSHMDEGDDIAFVRKNPDGTTDLTILGLELINRYR